MIMPYFIMIMLNIYKTKELIIDFRLKKAPFTPVLINGEAIEVVSSYKYLGVLVDSKLDWRENSSAMFKKAQSRLFFLRKLHSFNVRRPLLHVFYQSILASVMFYAVVCWGNGLKIEDKNKINKLIRKAGSIIGVMPDSLEMILDQRMGQKLRRIMNNVNHPMQTVFNALKSSFSDRLLMPTPLNTERFRMSFVPAAAKVYVVAVDDVVDNVLSPVYAA